MQQVIELTDNIYWLGTNDRRTSRFENIWPLPNGVAYNSYLIIDQKIALIDTVEKSTIDLFLNKLEYLLPEGRQIDYLVINHMEPDHSGGIVEVLQRFPNIKIVGNKMTFVLLRGFYNISSNQFLITDHQEIDLGSRKLRFYLTPWVHWPETMMTYDTKNKVLFAGDAFGSFGTLDGGIFDDQLNLEFYYDELLRYYSNIVGKYSQMVAKAMKKLEGLEFSHIASTHGPIWRSNIQYIIQKYTQWSSYQTQKGVIIVVGSMYGNTEVMADFLALELNKRGIKDIRIYDSAKTHISYILRDIWKYKGVIFGTSAYNAGAFPEMENLLQKLVHTDVKDHYYAVFGSSGWNRAGVKSLLRLAEGLGWENIGEPAETKASLDKPAKLACIEIAEAMANKLNQDFGHNQ